MNANSRLEEGLRAGNSRSVTEALAAGADLKAPGRRGVCALCMAAMGGDAELVRLLVKSGAKVAFEKGTKTTSVHEAAATGNLPVLEELLAADGKKALSWVDSDGCTPLMKAVQGGHIGAVRKLLAAGADVNARDPSTGNTALRIAAAEGTLQMARLLLDAGADPLIPGRMMLTPLDRARERRTPEGRMIAAQMEKIAELQRAKARAKAAGRRGGSKASRVRR